MTREIPRSRRWEASFNRYTPTATAYLTRLAAARARVDGSDILPAAEDELRVSALAETVHFSTLIEGNELPLIEAERAARDRLDPDTKARIELVNYVEALRLLDDLAERDAIEISPELLLELHARATRGLGAEGSEKFAPRHEGAWRDGLALVVDRPTGQVMHEGPPPEEVADRVASLCEWIREREPRSVDFPPPVLAGVGHYGITDVHPFADGNGRVARLFTAAVLMRLGYLKRRLFSLERYYAEGRDQYYAALRSVRASTFNMNGWLEYFLRGLAEEFERVAERVAGLERFGLRAGGKVELSESQERAIVQLNLNGFSEFRRVDYERLGEVGKTRSNRELKRLEEGGIIVRRGKGSAARYRFAAQPWEERRGRKREWTDARIEADLGEFCADRDDWPTVAEFRDAGRMALYEAIARYGGSRRWANRMGLVRGAAK